MKTKILFLIGSFGTGGMERQLAEIIKNLPNEEFEKYLFMKNFTGHFFSQISNYISGYEDLKQHNFDFNSIKSLKKYIERIQPQVVFSMSSTLSEFLLLLKPILAHKPIFLNASIQSAPDKIPFTQRFENIFLDLSKSVIGNSYAGLKAFKQNKKKNRFVLYNGFDFKRIPSISKVQAINKAEFDVSKFNILMVSSLRRDEFKDPITFLKTAKEIQNIDNSIMFYIAGDGERKAELEAFIEDNKINNVNLLGNRSDVETLFLASDLSILTSRTEGISNSIMESMACGVPCIATSGGGTPEIVEQGVNGYILPFGDYKAIAEKIMYLKNNPEVLKELGYRAKKTVEEKFSIERMIQNFDRIINIALNEK